MCAAALSRIGIRRVVFGCGNSKFGGCGTVLSVLPAPLSDGVPPGLTTAQKSDVTRPAHGSAALIIKGGVLAHEAISLLRRFYAAGNTRSK